MKVHFVVWGFILFLVFVVLWGSNEVVKLEKQGQKEKEQCIVLKYQKEAEKFLDMDCSRYVNYKQDNE